MIKKSFRLMLLVAFALSSVMFVACNKYDDDIDRIDQEIASLQATVQSLQSAISSGAVVTGVNNGTDGITFTMSNGQSYTVKHGTNGKDGQNGANGADGKTPVITIDPETNNWVIDGVDTGVCAKGAKGDKGDTGAQGPAGTNGTNGTNGTDGKDGQNGKDGLNGYSPKISEDGFWMVYDDENQTWVKTDVVAAFVHSYVVDFGSYYVLNVIEHDAAGEDAGWVAVKLPKTAVISNIKAASISKDGEIKSAVVTLNYGEKIQSKITFNGKSYALGTNLIAAGSSLSAFINPADVDASIYTFSLVDSKGNAPYVLSNVRPNMTDAPLTNVTRADATPNKGAWDMDVVFSNDLLFSDQYDLYDYAQARSKAAYALTTTTANGVVASAYDVKVTENKVELGDLASFSAVDLEGNVNEAIDLTETFGNTMQYVVDYYFTLKDKTAANTLGATLNGDKLVAKKPGTVQVVVNYLLVDGTYANSTSGHASPVIDVVVENVAESATLGKVEWEITNDPYDQYYGLSISGIKSLLNPTSDNDVVYVKLAGWTWADGTELDGKTVVANTVKYGEAGDAAHKFTGNEDSWIADIDEGATYRYSYGTTASNFSRSNYVIFNFDYANAFPGEYEATLEFRLNSNSGDALVTAPVKVTIKAPTATPFERLDAYFDGDNAVAYGDANGSTVTYDLFDLYEEMSAVEMANVTFSETKHSSSVHSGCAAWLTGNGGEIVVASSRYDYGSYNRDGVYTTRQMKANYVVFGNEHIPYVKDAFNLTIKSEIAEGTLNATAAKITITSAVESVPVSLKNVVAKDVYGKVYNLENTYSKDDDGNYTVAAGSRDSRIKTIEYFTEDTQYITVDATMANAQDGFSAFTVKRAGNTVLTKDKDCTVYVRVTDNWGRRTTSSFVVTLKK